MVRLTQIRPDDVLLDIACGTGDVARAYAAGDAGILARSGAGSVGGGSSGSWTVAPLARHPVALGIGPTGRPRSKCLPALVTNW